MFNRSVVIFGVYYAIDRDWGDVYHRMKRKIIRSSDKAFFLRTALAGVICIVEMPLEMLTLANFSNVVLWISGLHLVNWVISSAFVVGAIVSWGKHYLKRLLSLMRFSKGANVFKTPRVLLRMCYALQISLPIGLMPAFGIFLGGR